MMRRYASPLILSLLAAFACAKTGYSQQVQEQTVLRPGDVEPTSSRLFTFVRGTGVGHSHGIEAKFAEGSLVLGATANAGRFVIDTRSFDADTKRARQMVGLKGETAGWMRKQVNKEIHGSKILGSTEFPIAVFAIASAIPTGSDPATDSVNYELVGDFTLREVTRRIRVPATVKRDDGWLHLKGRFTFNQSDYGIKPLSKGLGAIGVADELTVFGDLWIAPTAQSLASIDRTLQRR